MKNSKKDKDSLKRWFKIFFKVLWILINLGVCFAMIFSAYAGEINPVEKPWSSIVAMAFPFTVMAMLTVLLIDIFACRRSIPIIILSVIVCLPSLADFCPLHIFNKSVPEGEENRAFSLMSYNVYNLVPYGMNTYDSDSNPYISYILEQQPDIVCLQEFTRVIPSESASVTEEQVDSLKKIYPYIIYTGKTLALFSKFPAEPLNFQSKILNNHAASVAAYRIHIAGHDVNVFNLHLQSFGLTKEDKQIYGDITSFSGEEERDVSLYDFKSHLLDKIKAGNVERARQAIALVEIIKKFGGEFVIVTGDFNDTPGCYSLHQLADIGLRQVYPEVGFGPMITYNANRFFFRIDHTLYRGPLKPLSMKKGKIKVSDHAPLTTVFLFDKEDCQSKQP